MSDSSESYLKDYNNIERNFSHYRKFKINSVGCVIGLLPDNPHHLSLVSRDTNWEPVPQTMILDVLSVALEKASDQTDSLEPVNKKLHERRDLVELPNGAWVNPQDIVLVSPHGIYPNRYWARICLRNLPPLDISCGGGELGDKEPEQKAIKMCREIGLSITAQKQNN